MKKTKHTEEQIIAAVKQMEAGRAAKELSRELGVTDQTLYNWKAKYAGMEVSEAKRLRQLEDENRRLKIAGGRDAGQGSTEGGNRKKRLELVSARRDVAFVVRAFQLSERHACKLLNLDRRATGTNRQTKKDYH